MLPGEEDDVVSTNRIAEIAALVGDPARAAMLAALMDGRALTATELARTAGVAPQTASGHLARLSGGGLLAAEKQGRHRYHRLASPAVARMIEGIMQTAAAGAPATRAFVRTGPRDVAMRSARTCYDHLAGRLGVAITDAMIEGGHLEFEDDGGALTDSGATLLERLGIALPVAGRAGRVFCRPCLDWSERRPHVAGRVGAAICSHCFERGWIRRIPDTRAVEVTPKGRAALRSSFRIGVAEPA
jgi:DNA-binding transcriptional ArsR family regulator